MDHRAESVEVWYARTRARLVGVITVMSGGAHDVDDIVDETITRAFDRWSERIVEEATMAWLVTVAMNLVRRRSRRSKLFSGFASRQPAAIHAATPDFSTELLDAVCALPPRQREAIALRYLLGLTGDQMAEWMGVTRGTTARTLFDARQALRNSLRDELAPDPEESA
jgi:RNA polymerase sigma factor (sigma-70 family)